MTMEMYENLSGEIGHVDVSEIGEAALNAVSQATTAACAITNGQSSIEQKRRSKEL